MEKDIKDYLHLYRGCGVEYFDYFTNTRRIGVIESVGKSFFFIEADNNGQDMQQAKPILRPLTSLTEVEDQIEFPRHNRRNLIDQHWYPEGFLWLLSKGFDLFGLIDAGLAIEAQTQSL